MVNLKENQFWAKCDRCGERVAPNQGVITGKRNGRWRVEHIFDCIEGPRKDKEEINSYSSKPTTDWQTPAFEGNIDRDYHG